MEESTGYCPLGGGVEVVGAAGAVEVGAGMAPPPAFAPSAFAPLSTGAVLLPAPSAVGAVGVGALFAGGGVLTITVGGGVLTMTGGGACAGCVITRGAGIDVGVEAAGATGGSRCSTTGTSLVGAGPTG